MSSSKIKPFLCVGRWVCKLYKTGAEKVKNGSRFIWRVTQRGLVWRNDQKSWQEDVPLVGPPNKQNKKTNKKSTTTGPGGDFKTKLTSTHLGSLNHEKLSQCLLRFPVVPNLADFTDFWFHPLRFWGTKGGVRGQGRVSDRHKDFHTG